MPLVVRDPGEIMRETKKDLYFIFKGKWYSFLPTLNGRPWKEFQEYNYDSTNYDPDSDRERCVADQSYQLHPPGHAELVKWFKENLPITKWEYLAPPETSGILAGGLDGRMCVHFDEASLAKFCERWEVNDVSVDPRFQCGYWSYADFAAQDEGPLDWDGV